jgi:endonuclease/exonuclease/phosphatase family metal-dependent hydrolase
MTWNIHGALGKNPRFDITRVIELIARADPDVMALQEVDSRSGEDCFALLQERLGRHGVGAKTIVTRDGDYGQMLISRWPLSDTYVSDISYGEFEPRRAIRAFVATPFGPLRVVATHLGLSIHERRSQARALLHLTQDDGPVVLLGDFNDWFWPGSVRSVLRDALRSIASIAVRGRPCSEAGPMGRRAASPIICR